MLRIEKVNMTFAPGTVNARVALREVSLHLTPGEFVTVIGSNGAGKSTLLNVVAGTIRADSGTVMIDGRDVTRLSDYQCARYIAVSYTHLTLPTNREV